MTKEEEEEEDEKMHIRWAHIKGRSKRQKGFTVQTNELCLLLSFYCSFSFD